VWDWGYDQHQFEGMAEARRFAIAVVAIRAKKKFAIANSETFGDFGTANGATTSRTAFDQFIVASAIVGPDRDHD